MVSRKPPKDNIIVNPRRKTASARRQAIHHDTTLEHAATSNTSAAATKGADRDQSTTSAPADEVKVDVNDDDLDALLFSMLEDPSLDLDGLGVELGVDLDLPVDVPVDL